MSNDPAKAKFIVLQALRWSGVGLVLAGLFILYGEVDVPDVVGYVLFVVGLLDALIMPGVLARMWKTPL
ncbi:MAG: hypothetical protein R3E09_05035 [Novosphingobium sp.]|nr:hypothetical protein [Novosphingobium sp.]